MRMSVSMREKQSCGLVVWIADRIKPGSCRDSLILHIGRLNVAHYLILAGMAVE